MTKDEAQQIAQQIAQHVAVADRRGTDRLAYHHAVREEARLSTILWDAGWCITDDGDVKPTSKAIPFATIIL